MTTWRPEWAPRSFSGVTTDRCEIYINEATKYLKLNDSRLWLSANEPTSETPKVSAHDSSALASAESIKQTHLKGSLPATSMGLKLLNEAKLMSEDAGFSREGSGARVRTSPKLAKTNPLADQENGSRNALISLGNLVSSRMPVRAKPCAYARSRPASAAYSEPQIKRARPMSRPFSLVSRIANRIAISYAKAPRGFSRASPVTRGPGTPAPPPRRPPCPLPVA
jgi:hypothetical protein